MLSSEKIQSLLTSEKMGNEKVINTVSNSESKPLEESHQIVKSEKKIQEGPIKLIDNFAVKNKLAKSKYTNLLLIDEAMHFNAIKFIVALHQRNPNILSILYKKDNKGLSTYTAFWHDGYSLRTKKLTWAQVEQLSKSKTNIDSLDVCIGNKNITNINDSELISQISELFGCAKSGANGTFKHETEIATKQPPKELTEPFPQQFINRWFIKKQPTCLNDKMWIQQLVIATREVVSGEMIRLMLPQEQPKSRFVLNTKEQWQNIYVASKEVKGYRSFSTFLKEKEAELIKNKGVRKKEDINKLYNLLNDINGLGTLAIIAIFLCEGDFKLDNFGVDAKGNIVKIDNDWCFSMLRLKSYGDGVIKGYNKSFSELSFEITDALLKNPIYPVGYSAWNWLQQITEGKYNPEEEPFFPMTMVFDEKFQREMNEAKLTTLLLSDDFLKAFIDIYYDSAQQLVLWFYNQNDEQKDKENSISNCSEILQQDKENILNTLHHRKEQIKSLVLDDESFKNYIASSDSEQFVEKLKNHVNEFKTTNKNSLQSKYSNLESMIEDNFSDIRSSIARKQCNI